MGLLFVPNQTLIVSLGFSKCLLMGISSQMHENYFPTLKFVGNCGPSFQNSIVGVPALNIYKSAIWYDPHQNLKLTSSCRHAAQYKCTFHLSGTKLGKSLGVE